MHEEIFKQLTIFQGLSTAQIALLRPLFTLCHEPEDNVIFDQGDPAENQYILADGEVHIRYKPEDGPEITIAKVRTNGVVGWSAALGTPAYTSAAICTTRCSMLCIKGQDLRQFCEQHPETGRIFLERLAAVVAERLRSTHAQVLALLEAGLRI